MSQQSEMADRLYDRLAQSNVSAAELVRELRTRWGPLHNAAEIHRFVEEVARCILSHKDVEIGEIHDGRFRSWKLQPWESDDKLTQELLSLDTFLDDNKKYVFRRAKT